MKPTVTPSQSPNVRIGIAAFRAVEERSEVRGRRTSSCLALASRRSIVAGLTRSNCERTSADTLSSPWRSSTGTSSGRNGANRLEQTRSVASQATLSALATSDPYSRRRPRRLPDRLDGWRKSRIADLRW